MPAAAPFTQEDPIGLAGGLNLYGFAGGDPVTFSDPFGLMADTAFADERARAETQKCVSESQTCADLIGALAKDKNLWTISTVSVSGDNLGEPNYNIETVPGGVYVRGGSLLIEGSAEKYAKASQETGVPMTYRSILAHEAGHVVGNLLFQQFGPLSARNPHCDERCALGPTNAYRADVGLPFLILRR